MRKDGEWTGTFEDVYLRVQDSASVAAEDRNSADHVLVDNKESEDNMQDDKLSGLEEQFAKDVALLRDLAVKSSDPLIVAKAVAASDRAVQQLILARLGSGERLVEVFALQGTTRPELQVFFRFVPAKEIVHFLDTGVLVFVDGHKGEVFGTVDPFTLQPERRVGRPFVTVAALNASAFAASNQAMEVLVNREHAFFRNLGLGRLTLGNFGVTTDTVCNTDVTSTTYSGQPYRPDDTGAEGTDDYCDSQGPILA